MEPEQLAPFAVEVWRLGQRLDTADLSRDRLNDSLRRLTAALEAAGVRFLDPTGHPYTDGMNAEVIAIDGAEPSDARDPVGALTIAQVLRPSVFVDDVCVVAPQIVVGRASAEGLGS